MLLLSRIREGFLHLLFPRLCEGCCASLLFEERVLCLSCLDQLPLTAYHHLPSNETVLRFAGRFPFVSATSYAYFTKEGLLQHLLHRLKYKGRKENGRRLGELLGYELQIVPWAQTVDVIVPVPLHPKKQAARGYNQSDLIAEGMSEVLGIPFLADGLKRVRHTESQTNKTRQERADNVQDAFRAKSAAVQGRHVLLVDDVLTTGATLEACSLALLDQNCKVSIATIGIASE